MIQVQSENQIAILSFLLAIFFGGGGGKDKSNRIFDIIKVSFSNFVAVKTACYEESSISGQRHEAGLLLLGCCLLGWLLRGRLLGSCCLLGSWFLCLLGRWFLGSCFLLDYLLGLFWLLHLLLDYLLDLFWLLLGDHRDNPKATRSFVAWFLGRLDYVLLYTLLDRLVDEFVGVFLDFVVGLYVLEDGLSRRAFSVLESCDGTDYHTTKGWVHWRLGWLLGHLLG